MKNNIKISVIVPAYNVEKYLDRCLDSLANQTLKDIEIICINDGSPDNCLQIMNNFKEKYDNFIVISQENQGLGQSRNNGIKIAKGEYIAFVDSDDWIDTDMFEVMYNKAIRTDADIVECDFRMRFESSNKIKNRRLISSMKSYKKFFINNGLPFCWKDVKNDLFYGLRSMVWNRIYKRDLIINNNLSFPKGAFEDYTFSFDAVLSATKIVHCGKVLYNYLVRKNSICNGGQVFQVAEIDFVEHLDLIIKKHNLEKELKRDFLEFKYKYFVQEYLKSVNNLQNDYKKYLSNEEFIKFRIKANKALRSNNKNIFQNIFSCSNAVINAENYKDITFLGKQYLIKDCKGSFK